MAQAHVATATLGVLRPPGIGPVPYQTLVSVIGRGTLVAIGVADGRNYHYFRITIDGVSPPLVDDYVCATYGMSANNGISLTAEFRQELRVEVRDNGAGSPSTCYWATWVDW